METSAQDQGFTSRVTELRPIAYLASLRVLGDRGRSEDIAQEALLRSMRRWAQIEPYAKPWISRVATNLAIDECRRCRTVLGDDSTAAVEGDADDLCLAVVQRDELRRALRALPHRQRTAIILRLIEGYSPDEAARAMGIDRAGVLKHTTRALATLRATLRPAAGLR
jgi:RNA polymerase sigma factor (sigma-70 family)